MITNKIKSLGKLLIEDTFRSLDEWRYSQDIDVQEFDNIYQYTTLDACSKIILSQDIWLFDSSHCNDKQEYKNGLDFVHSSFMGKCRFHQSDFPHREDDLYRYDYNDDFNTVEDKVRNNFSCFNSDWLCYIACFSRPIFHGNHQAQFLKGDLLENDNLSMWRGYGNEASGGCLGFDYQSMVRQFKDNPNCLFVEVLYDDAEKAFFIKCLFRTVYELYCNKNGYSYGRLTNILELDIERLFDRINNEDLFLSLAYALHLVPSFFKHLGFKEEREYRLIHSPEVIGKIDNRVSYLGRGKHARPYIPLSSIIDDLRLPIVSLTLGAQVSDQAFHKNIFKSKAWEYCNENSIYIQHSLLPYRS